MYKRSFKDIRKMTILYIKYLLRNFFYKAKWKLAYLLFLLSIALFLFIVIPNFVHRFPGMGLSYPRNLELDGTIYVQDLKNAKIKVPASNATIEVGGFSGKTDINGNYKVKFISDKYENIPVIINVNSKLVTNNITIKRISYGSSIFSKEEDFTIR